ncbi:hypothetical protein [Streptomyces sp. NPDC051662]|uniref:hypothetical protein n=1 Tax=Streptomyces sp. NPDC051662 TaxID=3154750 RepID=UPI003443107A
MERQTAAMRELSRRAFLESETPMDDSPAPIDQARAQRLCPVNATHAAALRRARVEHGGRSRTDNALVLHQVG